MPGILDQAAMAAQGGMPPQAQQGGMPAPVDPAMSQEGMVPEVVSEDDPMSLPGTEEATPEEQQQYDQAMAMVADFIYNNDASHIALMEMINAGAAEGSIVSSLVKATTKVITDIDAKINIPEAVIVNMADDVFMLISELAVAALGKDLTEKEVKQGVAGTTEMLISAYGLSKEDWYGYAEQVSEPQAKELAGYMEEIQ